jgi:hypothetical protein
MIAQPWKSGPSGPRNENEMIWALALAASPEDWPWSSYRSYVYGEPGLVRINDWTWWEEKIRQRAG